MHDLALQVSKSEALNLEAASAVDGASHIRHLNLISRTVFDWDICLGEKRKKTAIICLKAS